MVGKSMKMLVAGAIALGVSFASFAANADTDKFSAYVDDAGKITFPEDFRKNMIHLGSWFVPEGGASGFHGVYTELEAAEAFRETGKFPGGTTLVKELRASSVGDYTTGEGVSAPTTQLKQWFVMIKDTEGRFADNANWGHGWGWALYKPDNKAVNASSDYEADCLGCHVPAEATDHVYIEAYPFLHE